MQNGMLDGQSESYSLGYVLWFAPDCGTITGSASFTLTKLISWRDGAEVEKAQVGAAGMWAAREFNKASR